MHAILLFVLLSVTTGNSPSCNDGDSIVKKLSFENPVGPTLEQKAKLSELLRARCFYRAEGSSLSEDVYRQLCRFGYKHAYVQEPIIRVLDHNVRPFPVSVTIDFVLTSPDRVGRK